MIVGLTGTEAEVDRAFAAFKAYRRKVPTEGGDYTVDHSAGVYLYDGDGGFVGTLDMHEDARVRREKVERLLERPGSDEATGDTGRRAAAAGIVGGAEAIHTGTNG